MGQNANLEKDLEKFVKTLMYKFCHIIIQSRQGEKFKTDSGANSGSNEWFNLNTDEDPDIGKEIKKSLNFVPGESVFTRLPITIEFSLKTTDGDEMTLEEWTLDQSPFTDKGNQEVKSAQHVYNKITILLKSLLCMTRSTPAYKLSRKQCSGTDRGYTILFRICGATPPTHVLGNAYKTCRFGQIATSTGFLHIAVAYRTDMTIPSIKCEKLEKEDHYLEENKYSIDISKPLRPGPFASACRTKKYEQLLTEEEEDSSFSWVHRKKDGSFDFSMMKSVLDNEFTEKNNNSNTKNLEDVDSPVIPMFVPTKYEEEISEESLLNLDIEKQLMEEVHYPFATTSNHNDLAQFYREFFNAPKLHDWGNPTNDVKETSSVSTSANVDELTKQLQVYETCVDVYDKLLTTLELSTNNV